MKLPDRPVAVVTGAGGGLGRAIAVALGHRRARVVCADVDHANAGASARLVRLAGGEAVATVCDVGRWEDVAALSELTRATFGPADVLVNNAGVAVGGRVDQVSLDDWKWIVDVNLWGVVHGCRAFVPSMREQQRGWILNVASAAGFVCLPRFAPYNVTKAGVIALSETLRAELAPDNIGVSVLCPSFFRTGIVEAARGADDDDVDVRRMVRDQMERAKLTAEDVARHGIDALESGRLYAIPMRHARLAWAAKRADPDGFHSLLGLAGRRLGRRRRG